MTRLLTLVAAGLFALTGAAGAITITPGNTYQGTVSLGPDNLQASTCCPVIPGTTSFSGLQQYYIQTGIIPVGSSFTATLLDASGNVMATNTFAPSITTHNGGLGLGLGSLNLPAGGLPASGLFQITATGGPIDINSVELAANYNVQVQHPTLGPLATTLQSRNPVMNLALLQTQPPPGPNPTPVPLPAPMLLLVAGLASLTAMARRRPRLA